MESATSHLVTDVTEAFRGIKAFSAAGAPTQSIRIRILRNYAAELIEPFLKFYFGQQGIACETAFGGYGTAHQDILSADRLDRDDLVVLSLTLEGLEPDADLKGFDPPAVAQRITGLVDLVLERSPATVVINTVLRPIFDHGGAAHAASAGSASAAAAALNETLRTYAAAQAPRCVLVDWERLVMVVGADAAIDRRLAYSAGAPFKHRFLSLYAHEIFRIGRALKGGAKKCLILDCDNTLWGGVVGEVGPEGVALDRNAYPGKAYYDFQKSVLRLIGQGVMVALCSKNNLDDVMAVLDAHPHCLLKREHLVGHRINWQDKERNIRELVAELNIGMDAVVFVDDDAVECARMEGFLPDLTVLQVPPQLYDLPLLLERQGLFDRVAVTAEDLQRTRLYQAEGRRSETAASFESVEAFLASLELRARIAVAQPAQVARVAQLTQKTNQFNLTTRRYGEGDIARMLTDKDWAVLTLTPSDRFGDLGLSGVLIARRDGSEAAVDTLLLSCRVLGRRLEQQFVATCLGYLGALWGTQGWRAEYVPTKKNAQVAAFWPQFGFVAVETSAAGTRYAAPAAALRLVAVPFVTVEGLVPA